MMRSDQMANVVKTGWFGRDISVLLSNGKSVSGELSEVSDRYIVLHTKGGDVQVMVHAILVIRPASEAGGE